MRRLLAGLTAIGLAVGLSACGSSPTMSLEQATEGLKNSLYPHSEAAELKPILDETCEALEARKNMPYVDAVADYAADPAHAGLVSTSDIETTARYAIPSTCPDLASWAGK